MDLMLLFDVLLAAAGVFAMSQWLKLKTAGELVDCKLIYPSECSADNCRDPEGFYAYVQPRLLLFEQLECHFPKIRLKFIFTQFFSFCRICHKSGDHKRRDLFCDLLVSGDLLRIHSHSLPQMGGHLIKLIHGSKDLIPNQRQIAVDEIIHLMFRKAGHMDPQFLSLL